MMARTSSAVNGSPQIKHVYVYKLDHDTGMNPNPFGDYCTLAYCKHDMREIIVKDVAAAKSLHPGLSVGDIGIWVIGIAAKRLDFKGSNRYGRIVYAMQVTELLTFDEYWVDPRFVSKRPNRTSDEEVKIQNGHKGNYRFFKLNDNRRICGDNIDGRYDEGSRYVLVSDRFEYYGTDSENKIRLIDFLGLSEKDTMRKYRVYPSPSGKPIPEAVIEYIEHAFGARKCMARPTFSSPDFEV